MNNKKENITLTLSFEFALKIIEFFETLEKNRKVTIANQILKSGTSVGANIREAQSAESRADFIHKIKIAEKEAEETEYCLDLCKHPENYFYNHDLHDKPLSIKKILLKIISTSKISAN